MIATKRFSYDDLVTMTQVMALNGDVPANVGGWNWSEGYAGAVQRMCGIVGETAHGPNRTVYVCVRGCDVPPLPNSHPDYRPAMATAWVTVPCDPDLRFVNKQYHHRDGWRVK